MSLKRHTKLIQINMTLCREFHGEKFLNTALWTRIAFKKASNVSLAYDLCESDQLAGEMQYSNTSLQYSYPNELLRVKQKKKKTNLYSALFCRYLV